MKKILLLCIGFQWVGSCCAQTFDEWFRQKKTQIKYDLQQIAELEVLAKDLKKGYQIVQDGLNVINDIKHGDLNLHNDYFNSLLTVSPSIQGSSDISDTRNLQQLILQQYNLTTTQVKSSGQFTAAEISYIGTVFSKLLDGCSNDLSELTMLTTDGNYSLQDNERLTRITAIHADMLDKYNFVKHFGVQIALLVAQRGKEGSDAQSIQHIYDLK